MMAYFPTMLRLAVFAAGLSFMACSGGTQVPGEPSASRVGKIGAPAGRADALAVRLVRLHPGGQTLIFGAPLAPGALVDAKAVRVLDAASGQAIAGAAVGVSLRSYDAAGKPTSVRALRVELPSAFLEDRVGASKDVLLAWSPGVAAQPAPGVPRASFVGERVDAPLEVEVVARSVSGGALVEGARRKVRLHDGWEPRALASFPPGYLAGTGLFGQIPARATLERERGLASLRFVLDAAELAADMAVYRLPYLPTDLVGEDSSSAVVDLNKAFEAWLYDRCATQLVVGAAADDVEVIGDGFRACAFYASQIDARGFFGLKKDEKGQGYDEKYSQARGLYLYYALSGDESALAAVQAVAKMWDEDPYTAGPYRKQGKLRGADKLWTERHLSRAFSAAVYGFLMTGEARHLTAARELYTRMLEHIAAPDAKAIEKIIGVALPPQDCFVHTSSQHEGYQDTSEPWCSTWMSALLVDPLLRWKELTGDPRVDEIFVRLARFVRDRGTRYMTKDPLNDSFVAPSACRFPPDDDGMTRNLVPVEGAGLRADGTRYFHGEYEDFDHCLDVSSITGAALLALRKQGWDAPGPAPFKTQGASILALHHELLACASVTFGFYERPKRDPRQWTQRELASASGDFVGAQKIGWPPFNVMPPRKFGWWFTSAIEAVGLVGEAGLDFSVLRPGAIQPAGKGCPPAATF